MAIYHLHTSNISRGKGRDATAAAAYRAGMKIKDERTGIVHDYTKRKGVTDSEGLLFMPKGVTWNPDRAELWNTIELKNIRKDSRTAREFEIALPKELTAEKRKDLAVAFAKNLADRYCVAADLSLHTPRKGKHDNHNDNYHMHIMLTTDTITGNGEVGNKNREMNAKAELEYVRQLWETEANKALKLHGVIISCKTLAEQGIEREPQIHEGPHVSAMEREKGVRTDIRQLNENIKARNAGREAFRQRLTKFQTQIRREIEKTDEKLAEIEARYWRWDDLDQPDDKTWIGATAKALGEAYPDLVVAAKPILGVRKAARERHKRWAELMPGVAPDEKVIFVFNDKRLKPLIGTLYDYDKGKNMVYIKVDNKSIPVNLDIGSFDTLQNHNQKAVAQAQARADLREETRQNDRGRSHSSISR